MAFSHFIFVCLLLILSIAYCSADAAADNFYYSNTVPEATEKFLTACSAINGSIETIDHPLRGVEGELLQVAVCAVGDANSRSVVFTISGTHGIEGYAGSMAQISMLRGPSSMFPPGVRMIHLHMINPYGASFVLKENEQNADQYKNLAEFYSTAYDNPILQELIDGINLKNLNNQTEQQNALATFARLIQKYGEENVNEALKIGQGKRPEGIAYFGPNKSWSSNTTEYVMNKYLSNLDKLFVIDLHTAVGPYGKWVFLPIDRKTEIFFKRWVPNALISEYDVRTPPGGETPFNQLRKISKAKRFWRCLWEAGTYPVTPETNAAFFLRLYCRFYSNRTDPFCQNIIGQIQEFFYPQKVDWRNMTYHSFNEIFPEILTGFVAEHNQGNLSVLSQWMIILSFLFSIYFS